jgi:Zn-dependent peptidase ImmA (M78 family)
MTKRDRKKEVRKTLLKTYSKGTLDIAVKQKLVRLSMFIMDYFVKPISKEEAKKFVESVSNKKVIYRDIPKNHKYQTAHILNTKKSIIIRDSPEKRNIITLSHELGHHISSKKINTFNKERLKNLLDNNNKTTTHVVYGSEVEAWEEAKKLTKPTALFKLERYISLKSYSLYISDFLIKKDLNNKEQVKTYWKVFCLRTVSMVLAGLLGHYLGKEFLKTKAGKLAAIVLPAIVANKLVSAAKYKAIK